MLKLHTIRFRNLLSYGNNMTEVDIDKYALTYIKSPNGSGKSTLLDAVCFALYGKPLRNIPKPAIINNTNKKNLLVEIEFSTQNNQYVVRRGMKPNIFEIYCNGTMIPTLPSVIEMQDYLEKYILKCNFKAFTQVVILGMASYVQFMQLTPAARREIIEDILDIEVFSVMHNLLKERLSNTKDELAEAQQEAAVIQSQHDLAETYAKQQALDDDKRKAKLQAELDHTNGDIKIFTENLVKMDLELAKYGVPSNITSDVDTQLGIKQSSEFEIKSKIKAINKSINFFESNNICGTCSQDINEKTKEEQLNLYKANLASEESFLKTIQNDLELLNKRKAEHKKSNERYSQIFSAKQTEQFSLSSSMKDKARLEAELNKPAQKPPQIELGDLDAARDKVDTLIIRKSILEQGNVLLKDNGIKTRIINQYLPVINKTLNKYLSLLNFPIHFTLNEQFQETIKSKGRDEFTYGNFSEGEKRRIDMAFILTWRDIARLKNSVACNLLIFDEIFDGSLDTEGIEDFMKVLQKMDKTTNVFLISHKMDSSMSDKFNNTILISKKKGFSILEKAK